MAKHLPMGPIKGAQDLYMLLKVFDDHELYSERLGEMEAVRKEINDLIELIAPANQIQPMHEEAKTVLATARQKSDEVIEYAKELATEAERKAGELQAESARAWEDVENKGKVVKKRQEKTDASLLEREVAAVKLEKELRVLQTSLTARSVRLEEDAESLETQKAKLMAAMVDN